MTHPSSNSPESKILSPSAPISDAHSVDDLLRRAAQQWSTRIALRSPDCEPGIQYHQLAETIHAASQKLRQHAVNPTDRVATFLPPGMLGVQTMLALMSAAVFAPVNPRFGVAETVVSLRGSGARAVVLEHRSNSPARKAAELLALPIIEAQLLEGRIQFQCTPWPHTTEKIPVTRPACVIQTSGTTSIPKVVPILAQPFLNSLLPNITEMQITQNDRLLLMTPTAHLVGIMPVLYGIMAGAELICCPGHAMGDFWNWIKKYRPTYMSGSPAVHHSVRASSKGEEKTARDCGMRILRAGAAPMPERLQQNLEVLWNATVITAYGMSECPLITTSGIHPSARRQGSVGRERYGIEVAILDHHGTIHAAANRTGITGELLLRGPHVMTAYENAPEANTQSFTHGWFRTGDLGTFDPDGFLFLRGRKKELINRGGTKISPVEIDEVILKHPAVAEALAFPLPHERLGESVAAAIVLHQGKTATESQLQQFVAAQLGMDKVPDRLVFLDSLPKSKSGKHSRTTLAENLGLTKPPEKTPFAPASTTQEEALEAIWSHILKREGRLSVEDHFVRDLGGDSLQAVAMLNEAAKFFGKELPVATLLTAPTVRALAKALTNSGIQIPDSDILTIQKGNPAKSALLFCLPGRFGQAFGFYSLARRLGDHQPVYGLTLPGVHGNTSQMPATLQQLAAHFITQIRTVQPTGPYNFVGYSFGGYLAFEMARQLTNANQSVANVIMFDTRGPGFPKPKKLPARLLFQMTQLRRHGLRHSAAYIKERLMNRLGRPAWKVNAEEEDEGGVLAQMPAVSRKATALIQTYQPRPYPGKVTLIRAQIQPDWHRACIPDQSMGWRPWAPNLQILESPGGHHSILAPQNIDHLATLVSAQMSCPPP